MKWHLTGRIWATALVSVLGVAGGAGSALAQACDAPISRYTQSTVQGVAALDLAQQVQSDSANLDVGEVALTSDNALMPRWRESCGFHISNSLAGERLRVNLGGSMPLDGGDSEALAYQDDEWHSYVSLGSGWQAPSGLIGFAWESAYAGRLNGVDEAPGNHLGFRGEVSVLNGWLKSGADVAFSLDGEERALAAATDYRLDAILWRSDALKITALGRYGRVAPDFIDQEMPVTADRELRIFGGAIDWRRLDLSFEQQASLDNLDGSLDRTTEHSIWRGQVGFDLGGWHPALPEKVVFKVVDGTETATALANDEYPGGPWDRTRDLTVEAQWALYGNRLTFGYHDGAGSSWDEDGTGSRSSQRNLLLGYKHSDDFWDLSTGASLGRRFDSDDTGQDGVTQLGLAADLIMAPAPNQEIELGADVDFTQGGSDRGGVLDELSIDLVYRLRF